MVTSFTDCFGRVATQNDSGSWSAAGVTIGPCNADQAGHTLSGMAPASYTPPEAPAVVPQSVTLVQLRLAMLQTAGRRPGRTLLHDVDDVLQQAAPDAIQLWEYSVSVDRFGQLAGLLTSQCGLSGLRIDNLFRNALRICT
jgi:hypothetical protein